MSRYLQVWSCTIEVLIYSFILIMTLGNFKFRMAGFNWAVIITAQSTDGLINWLPRDDFFVYIVTDTYGTDRLVGVESYLCRAAIIEQIAAARTLKQIPILKSKTRNTRYPI